MNPCDARTEAQICRLKRDNFSTRDGWISVLPGRVSIYQQRSGYPSAGCVTLSKAQFDRLIAWYRGER